MSEEQKFSHWHTVAAVCPVIFTIFPLVGIGFLIKRDWNTGIILITLAIEALILMSISLEKNRGK